MSGPVMVIGGGTRIDGRYEVLGPIGKGGMAAVYKARHLQLGSLHAIKVLSLPTPAVQKRLLQEGELQSKLKHPNIVSVTDVVEVGGSPGLVMEFVDGPSLYDLLKRTRLTLPQAAHLAQGILAGVAHAHAHGLVHRDLKPNNILLATEAGTIVPKITDFGLAKVLEVEGGGMATRSGIPMGTPSYMAPEQIKDASRVDARADVFAVGAILYELVGGQRAFTGEDMVEVFTRIKAGDYVSPKTLAPDLPDAWADAIEGALNTDPAARFADCQPLIEACTAPELDTPWDEVSLELVSSMGPKTDDGPQSSSTYGGSDPTWAFTHVLGEPVPPSSIPSEVQSPPPTPAPVRPRSLPVAWLAGVVVAAVLVLGAWVAWPEPSPDLTLDHVPQVIDDPALQTAFEEAWAALLDADFAGAERRLRVVVESDPDDPRIWLTWERTLRYADKPGESIEAFWTAANKAETTSGPGAELARRAARTRRDTWPVSGHHLAAHVEAHPDDILGVLVVSSLSGDPVWQERLAKQAPEAALTWVLGARGAMRGEEWAKAERLASDGLVANPGNPTLLQLQGEALLRRGHVDAAVDALSKARELDPGQPLGWYAAARITRGDDPEPLIAQGFADTSVSRRARFAVTVAEALWGIGRVELAATVLARALEGLSLSESWLSHVTVGSQVATMRWISGQIPEADVATKRLVAISQAPEIPDGERPTLVRNLLYAQGVIAARKGDIAEADAILARLRGLDGIWPVYIEWLSHEVAAAKRDVDGAAAPFSSGADCERELTRGMYVDLAGGDPVPILQAALTGDCQQFGEARYSLARAHVVLAERTGDRGHIEAFDRLLPEPDATLPIVTRRRALD